MKISDINKMDIPPQMEIVKFSDHDYIIIVVVKKENSVIKINKPMMTQRGSVRRFYDILVAVKLIESLGRKHIWIREPDSGEKVFYKRKEKQKEMVL